MVGFMAAGKSTIGRRLASRLGWEFVDFDERIRERTGRTAAALIREQGEPALRALEAALTDELADGSRVVLAPGGGWGADPTFAGRLGPGTIRVWLRITAEEAVRRAREDARRGVDRPLLGPADEPDASRIERARSLLAGREQAYAAAEVVVDVDGREPAVVVDEVVRRLNVESGGP